MFKRSTSGKKAFLKSFTLGKYEDLIKDEESDTEVANEENK